MVILVVVILVEVILVEVILVEVILVEVILVEGNPALVACAHFTAGLVKMKEGGVYKQGRYYSPATTLPRTQSHHTKRPCTPSRKNAGAKLPSFNVFNPLPVGFAGR